MVESTCSACVAGTGAWVVFVSYCFFQDILLATTKQKFRNYAKGIEGFARLSFLYLIAELLQLIVKDYYSELMVLEMQ